MSDTIFALASGPGPSAIAIIRLSGERANAVATALCGFCPEPRRAMLADLRHPISRDLLDRGLALWFPGPASFTGEDCLEFHVHGGRAVVAAVLLSISMIEGCRPATAGEFTRRAFINGKLDLTSVEGLADLIESDTEQQRRQALASATGGLRIRAEQWRSALLELSALVEARLDFPEEIEAQAGLEPGTALKLLELAGDISNVLKDGQRAEIIREGFRVVIVGPPNAGKSTLMNALAGRDVAIISSRPGTTRDPIEVTLNLRGMAIVVVDTAGIQETEDEIEREGIARSFRRVEDAHLVLWLNASDAMVEPPGDLRARNPVRVTTKIDLHPGERPPTLADDGLTLSAKTGFGVDALLDFIYRRAYTYAQPAEEPSILTRERQRVELQSALDALGKAGAAGLELELVAEELRKAARSLAALVGQIHVEDVLGEIFGRFCIGK